jgi:hypothetical protein
MSEHMPLHHGGVRHEERAIDGDACIELNILNNSAMIFLNTKKGALDCAHTRLPRWH